MSIIIMEEFSHKNDESVTKILERSVTLFRRTGLTDLASKSEKILNNFNKAMSLR